MALCVYLAPAGVAMGLYSGRDVFSGGAVLMADPSCSSGLQILTQAEIQANKSQLTMDTTSDPQRVADMLDLFYAFMVVLVVVWGLKQLLNLFTGDTSKD